MKFLKIGEIWKELDQTQKMQPTGTFSDQPFRSYSSLKMTCLTMKCKIRSVFLFLGGQIGNQADGPDVINGQFQSAPSVFSVVPLKALVEKHPK
jgi:hypothetical protein